MLTLRRRKGERIVLTTSAGERITVLVEHAGATVSLAIAAPQTVTVNRGEVQDKIDAEVKRWLSD